MKFSKDITINVPAKKVWDILGHKFADVGQWSSLVSRSTVNNDASKVNNSPVGGRFCETGIGKISEEFTAYDEKGMTFSFKGVITSIMFSKVISTNAVTAIDENTSKVTLTPNIDLKVLGILMYPLIKMNLGKLIKQALMDLKYFAENDKPSPEKLASQK
ncbi:SRPBCC family protein [Candidatus Marinimicrobia bacterium MT.SAG.4]|nr:SRPBCC family protein [Candidatus Marinimicrobia bacterium MT.SAG.4]